MNGLMGANYPMEAAQATMPAQRRLDITIGQNLDEQIKQAEARLQELRDTKDRMEQSGILTTRIDDLQRALRW